MVYFENDKNEFEQKLALGCHLIKQMWNSLLFHVNGND